MSFILTWYVANLLAVILTSPLILQLWWILLHLNQDNSTKNVIFKERLTSAGLEGAGGN